MTSEDCFVPEILSGLVSRDDDDVIVSPDDDDDDDDDDVTTWRPARRRLWRAMTEWRGRVRVVVDVLVRRNSTGGQQVSA